MGVKNKGKWIVVSPTDMHAAEAAEHTLRLRLKAVCDLLPRAAQDAGQDVEPVHQLRVACRRATACVHAYRSLIPSGKKRIRSWLNDVRQAAGPARDLDVLLQRLLGETASQAATTDAESTLARLFLQRAQGLNDGGDAIGRQLIEHLQRQRLEVQQALVDIHVRSQRESLTRAFDKCLRGLHNSRDPQAVAPFQEFAAAQVAKQVERFVGDCQMDRTSIEQLHELRISGKRLRYSLELFQSALPKQWRKNAYKRIADLQERLGRINDHAAAQLFFQRMLADMPADALAAYVADLVILEHQSLAVCRAEFLDWWTEQVRQEFTSLLVGSADQQQCGSDARQQDLSAPHANIPDPTAPPPEHSTAASEPNA